MQVQHSSAINLLLKVWHCTELLMNIGINIINNRVRSFRFVCGEQFGRYHEEAAIAFQSSRIYEHIQYYKNTFFQLFFIRKFDVFYAHMLNRSGVFAILKTKWQETTSRTNFLIMQARLRSVRCIYRCSPEGNTDYSRDLIHCRRYSSRLIGSEFSADTFETSKRWNIKRILRIRGVGIARRLHGPEWSHRRAEATAKEWPSSNGKENIRKSWTDEREKNLTYLYPNKSTKRSPLGVNYKCRTRSGLNSRLKKCCRTNTRANIDKTKTTNTAESAHEKRTLDCKKWRPRWIHFTLPHALLHASYLMSTDVWFSFTLKSAVVHSE